MYRAGSTGIDSSCASRRCRGIAARVPRAVAAKRMGATGAPDAALVRGAGIHQAHVTSDQVPSGPNRAPKGAIAAQRVAITLLANQCDGRRGGRGSGERAWRGPFDGPTLRAGRFQPRRSIKLAA